MSTPERKTPQALRSRQPDPSASGLRPKAPAALPEGLLLSLHQTVGNQAVSALVQRWHERVAEGGSLQGGVGVSLNDGDVYVDPSQRATGVRGGVVQRVAYRGAVNRGDNANVDDSGNPITATGAVGAGVVVDGKLKYGQKKIPYKAVGDESFAGLFWDKDALEIMNLDAKPGGYELGKLLMWHLARLARKERSEWVVAGNVTGAREKVYMALGFRDFKNAPTWQWLVDRKKQLQQEMAAAKGEPSEEIAKEFAAVNKAMEENKIFISAAELEENTQALWSQRWV